MIKVMCLYCNTDEHIAGEPFFVRTEEGEQRWEVDLSDVYCMHPKCVARDEDDYDVGVVYEDVVAPTPEPESMGVVAFKDYIVVPSSGLEIRVPSAQAANTWYHIVQNIKWKAEQGTLTPKVQEAFDEFVKECLI